MSNPNSLMVVQYKNTDDNHLQVLFIRIKVPKPKNYTIVAGDFPYIQEVVSLTNVGKGVLCYYMLINAFDISFHLFLTFQ